MVDRAEFIFVLTDQTAGGATTVGGVPSAGGMPTQAVGPQGTIPAPSGAKPPVLTEAEKPSLPEPAEPILAEAIPNKAAIVNERRERRQRRITGAAAEIGQTLAARAGLGRAAAVGTRAATAAAGIVSSPAALAAGAAVGLAIAAPTALALTVRAGGRRAGELAPFSPDVAAARGRAEVRRVRRGLEAGENLGPILARLADEQGELAVSVGRIKDTVTGPLFSVAADILDTLNTFATPLARLIEENQEEIGTSIGILLKSVLGLLGAATTINELLEKDDVRKATSIFEFLATERFIDPPAELGIVSNEAPFDPVVAGIPGGFQ